MVKNAIKREQSQMVNVQWSMFNGNNAEREHFRRSQCLIINGQCSKMRLSEYKRELVLILSSVSILGAANVQCSMAIMQSVSILGAANVQ